MESSSYMEKALPKKSAAAISSAKDDLAALYDAHAPALYRLLLAMLGAASDAQDALGEVFLQVAKGDIKKIRHPRAYLLKAARNQALQMLRRRKRELTIKSDEVAFFDCSDLQEERRLLACRIEAALYKLPTEQREVVVLKVYEELTFAEIAEITRTSQNTITSRYRYALEKLRRSLEEE